MLPQPGTLSMRPFCWYGKWISVNMRQCSLCAQIKVHDMTSSYIWRCYPSGQNGGIIQRTSKIVKLLFSIVYIIIHRMISL